MIGGWPGRSDGRYLSGCHTPANYQLWQYAAFYSNFNPNPKGKKPRPKVL